MRTEVIKNTAIRKKTSQKELNENIINDLKGVIKKIENGASLEMILITGENNEGGMEANTISRITGRNAMALLETLKHVRNGIQKEVVDAILDDPEKIANCSNEQNKFFCSVGYT